MSRKNYVKNPNIEKRQFWNSANANNFTYEQYYNRLTELAISMFQWNNLPETVDPRLLELALYANGQALFFKDEALGYLALRSTADGMPDVYDIPSRRRAFASNGYQYVGTPENSVVVYNNYLRTNSMLDTSMFAHRLYNLDRAIDVNANAQKTPILIQCDESQMLTMKNIYEKYDGNIPVIMATKQLETNGFNVLKTDAPFVCDKLYELKTQIWNEALTYLGIANVSYVKKERMISDEVTRSQGGVVANRYSRLKPRQIAAEQINKMFGLNITVEYSNDFDEEKLTALEQAYSGIEPEKEDDNNE